MGQGEDQTGAMEIDKTYLLPVRLSSEDISTMDGSSVAYYLVKRSSAITVAAQLTDNWIEFPLMDTPGEVADAYNGLTALTYEALLNVDRFDLNNKDGVCNISTVMGVEQYLLLRIGDANFERQCLQFDGSGNGSQFGKLPSKSDPAKKLYSGSWYHVACTYDQNERVARIYVNGKLIDEVKEAGVAGPTADNKITLAMRALGMPEAYQFSLVSLTMISVHCRARLPRQEYGELPGLEMKYGRICIELRILKTRKILSGIGNSTMAKEMWSKTILGSATTGKLSVT